MYAVHDLNGLDAYTLHIVLEQDSKVARHQSTNYMYAIPHVLYSMQHDTCIHCSHATCEYLMKFFK